MVVLLSTIALSVGINSYGDQGSGDSAVSTTYNESDQVTTASGSNRFVVWQDDTPGNFDILFKRSSDNGATWKSTVNLSSNPGQSSSPQIAVSGSSVYVVWTQWNVDFTSVDILLRRSTDNGVTWKSVVNLSKDANDSSFPRLAASGPYVYVIWTSSGDGNAGTLLRRSTDNGETWKSAFKLSEGGGEDSQISILGSNVYFVTPGSADGSLAVLFRRSTDNGATWRAEVVVAKSDHGPAHVQLAASGSNVYVVWSDRTENFLDIFFRRSTDGGATWKSAKVLQFNSGNSEHPQIAVSGSNIYVVWEDKTPAPGINDIFYMRSTDNGATWESRVNLSKNSGYSNNPQIAISGSNVYVVWFDNTVPPDATLSYLYLVMRRSTDDGATWKPIQTLRSDINSNIPDLVVSGPNVCVTWTEDTGDYPDVFFRRSTDGGATWKSAINLSKNPGDSGLPQLGL